MKRPHQISNAVLMAFSSVVARESLDMELYTAIGPGPGFLPFWISVFLGLLGALGLYQATFWASDPMPEGFFPSRIGFLRMGAIILALIGTIVLMKPLGFRLTLLAFLVLLLSALGRQRLIVTALVAAFGSFGVYYVFNTLLKVSLPVGMFGI